MANMDFHSEVTCVLDNLHVLFCRLLIFFLQKYSFQIKQECIKSERRTGWTDARPLSDLVGG